MKCPIIIILAVVAILLLSVILTLNVRMDYTTVVRVESVEQHTYLVQGREPEIRFVSLRDTPFGDEVKILKVRYHTTIDCLFNSKGFLEEWLAGGGMRNYPEFIR